jgi:hypothetical protein
LGYFELNPLTLVERTVAVRLDGRVVDEDVLAAVYGDEAVALFVVEPLDRALRHVHSLLGDIRLPPFVETGVFVPRSRFTAVHAVDRFLPVRTWYSA